MTLVLIFTPTPWCSKQMMELCIKNERNATHCNTITCQKKSRGLSAGPDLYSSQEHLLDWVFFSFCSASLICTVHFCTVFQWWMKICPQLTYGQCSVTFSSSRCSFSYKPFEQLLIIGLFFYTQIKSGVKLQYTTLHIGSISIKDFYRLGWICILDITAQYVPML